MTDRIERSATADQGTHGERLDQLAARLFPDFSRSRLQGWIRAGALRVDGQVARPRDAVLPGALLTLSTELEDLVTWQAQPIALEVIYEDDSIIVIDKPPGLVVHPAAGHSAGTLVNALLNHSPTMAQLPRAGLVHRLDKDTSGVLVAAQTLQAHNHLVGQLAQRSMGREYAAVCIGAMTGGGTVDAPMGRHPQQRKKMAVLASGGKSAITHYRIARRFANHTHITVRLETGRTHQIRVHMAHRRYPLLGDTTYGGRARIPARASQSLIDGLRSFPRQALHAQHLQLIHPVTGESMQFQSPLPADLQTLLELLDREDRLDPDDC